MNRCVSATVLSVCAAAVTLATPAHAAEARWSGNQVRQFLIDFYGEHGPTDWKREHQVGAELKKKAAATPDHDLLLCAQDIPCGIGVGKVTTAQSARVGWATVTTRWGTGRESFTAYVDLDATRPIELLDVDCAAV